MMSVDTYRSELCFEPHQRRMAEGVTAPPNTLWRSIRHLWCRHRETVVTPKVNGMPAHVVCQKCGWREPLMASAPPRATRTWDSSRDEERYQREKKRREAVEAQRQQVIARLATPEHQLSRRTSSSSGHVVELKRAAGE
jgi:hypothetical protein